MAISGGSSSSSIPPSPWKHHVFLSFRGEDTRTGFTDHLHAALQQRGIITFIDDELQRGEVISDQLLQAIDESLISLVILSKNYASSHCREVIPVFYEIDPSHVRYQRGTFADAFHKHNERYPDKVQGWRDVLKEIADLSGYHSANRHETKFIEEIVTGVWTKLQPSLPCYDTKFVGMESKIEEVNSILRMGMSDVRLLGIWGMGGIGKTSLARVIYETNCNQFDLCYFAADVRDVCEKEGSLVPLQRKFLSRHGKLRSIELDDAYEGMKIMRSLLHNQKALIVLDDVSEMNQLEYLAIKQSWLGPGSRIIVTTRNKHLLTAHGEFKTYEAKLLNNEESLQLFCQKAFNGDKPTEDYLELSKSVVELAAGLPLTLEVLGCHLCGGNVLEWKDTLEKIKKVPPNDIIKRLRISYEALDDQEEKIFLDIACLFKGMHEEKVIEILEICDLHPIIGIKRLVDKCLVIENHYNDDTWHLDMHDILQEMGKSIVLEESPGDAGKRSRLWTNEDINDVLTKDRGTNSIEVILLQSTVQCEDSWDPEAFSNMSNLRILIISCNVCLPYGLKCLPSSLKLLEWEKYPFKSLPPGVHLNELIELKMHCSKIKQLWNKTQIPKKLKLIDLSYSEDLIQTPDFSLLPNLERLLLEGCIKLAEVHPSLGHHKKIVAVNLKDCKNLKTLPCILEMDSLNELILSGCSKLQVLPEFGENMKCLSMLELKDCRNLVCLPDLFCHLKSLKTLNTSGCSKLLSLPENLDENESREELDINGTLIREILPSINGLKSLRKLDANRSTRFACDSLPNLLSVTLRLFGFNRYKVPIRLTLPPSISGLSSLKELKLRNCNMSVESIPNDLGHLPSLEVLDLGGNNFGSQLAGKLILPASFLSLSSLRELYLDDCNLCDGSIPDNLCSLSSLTTLCLSRNNFTHLPPNLVSNLLALQYLLLDRCSRLVSLPSVPPNIEYLNAICCHPSMESLDFLQVLWNFLSKETNLKLDWGVALLIPGSEIPSWFHNENTVFLNKLHRSPDDVFQSRQFSMDNKNIGDNYLDCIVSVKVDISRFCGLSERWGVFLCFELQDMKPANSRNPNTTLWISCGARTSNDFLSITMEWKTHLEGNKPQLLFWFLPASNVGKNNNLVELIITADRGRSLGSLWREVRDKSEGKSERGGRVLIKKCCWRVTSKEKMEKWRRTRVHQESREDVLALLSTKEDNQIKENLNSNNYSSLWKAEMTEMLMWLAGSLCLALIWRKLKYKTPRQLN